MIEELKQILGIIKDVPHMVMWVLAGLLLYKVVYVGSIFGIIRLFILKGYEYLKFCESKPTIIHHKIDRYFITHDGTFDRFIDLIRTLRTRESRGLQSEYIHKQDIRYLENLIAEDLIKNKSVKEQDSVAPI